MEQREKGIVRTNVAGQQTVTTYYLRQMNADLIEKYGLAKYMRKDVKSDEQGS